MAGYVKNIGETNSKESRWISLKPGTYIVRILPPHSSYFDQDAEPLDFFYYQKRTVWSFPLLSGAANIVVDNNSIVQRAMKAYQATLGDWETQKTVMKKNGLSRFWAQLRGGFNVITNDKKDKPYWIDLPKTALKSLVDKIKADPTIIDLEKGRFIRINVTGSGGQNDKDFEITVSNKPVAITLDFDYSLLDDLQQACAPTEISVKDIQEPTIKKFALEILKAEKEVADLDEAEAVAIKKPARTTSSAPAPKKSAPVDDGFDEPDSKKVDDNFGLEAFESSATTPEPESEDVAAFRTALTDDEFDS